MESKENRVNVRGAVKIAIDFVEDLYRGKNLQDVLLEEVEFSDTTNQWLVTVGFSLPENKTKEESQTLITPFGRNRLLSRCYKVVSIDAKTGQPVSMKIRNLQQ